MALILRSFGRHSQIEGRDHDCDAKICALQKVLSVQNQTRIFRTCINRNRHEPIKRHAIQGRQS